MACSDIEKDLQAFLDDELSPTRQLVVETHLKQCENCRVAVEELRAVSQILTAWKDHPVRSDLAESGRYFPKITAATFQEPPPIWIPLTPPRQRRIVRPLVYRMAGPVAVAAAVVIVAGISTYGLLNRGGGSPGARIHRSATAVAASASEEGAVADARIYAGIASNDTISAPMLDPGEAALEDVVYAFVTAARSDGDKRAAAKVVDLLAQKGQAGIARSGVDPAELLAAVSDALFSRAAADEVDPFARALDFELAGRYREAAAEYEGLSSGGNAERAGLARAAILARAGDLPGAQEAIRGPLASADPCVKRYAEGLSLEIQDATDARTRVAALKLKAATPEAWVEAGRMEAKSYLYPEAAASFMKAANAAGGLNPALAAEATMRSALCQKECGQIATAIYGFRAVESSAPNEGMKAAAGIEEAVGLARLGRAGESVSACAKAATTGGDGNVQALLYFEKGTQELRAGGDRQDALSSLSRAACCGQGSLSYAAQILIESNGL